MKKLLIVLLVALTCVCVTLSACKKKEEAMPTTPPAEQVTPPAEEAAPAPEAAAPAPEAAAPEAPPAAPAQ